MQESLAIWPSGLSDSLRIELYGPLKLSYVAPSKLSYMAHSELSYMALLGLSCKAPWLLSLLGCQIL